jgi:hypothetical protein
MARNLPRSRCSRDPYGETCAPGAALSGLSASVPLPAAPPRPEPARSPEPLGSQRYRVQFTANAATHAKLREAQALLRHSFPDGDLAAIFDRALTALLREARRDRFAETDRPRKSPDADATGLRPSRHVPAAVRRQVVRRDGGRYTFVSPTGHRCGSREALEFHHTESFARRAHHSVEGITLRCRTHNRLAAVLDFGAEHMSRFRRGAGAEAPRPTRLHERASLPLRSTVRSPNKQRAQGPKKEAGREED